MKLQNDGYGKSSSLQNRFTAYLQVAVGRCKKRYLNGLHTLLFREPSHDFQEEPMECAEEPDLMAGLSLMDTAENEAFLSALRNLPPRDLKVLLDVILRDKQPAELSEDLGLSYQGAMAVYYRALKKLRKQLEKGEPHEF